jgi:geranylgeranyl diphosphate synthase type I
MIEDIRKNIELSLAEFLEKVKLEYKFHLVKPVLYDSIREYTLRKGKRIRPLLLILSYKGYADPNTTPPPSLYFASTCMEFLHNFMLIHDDIIDRSDLRRGKPALHKKLRDTVKSDDPEKIGYDLAIIAGDIIYALAIDAFLSIEEEPRRKEKALKYFIQTATFTAMGEFIDTIHGVEPLANVTEDDVLLNYTLKTARYTFDCPLVTGAILAGADERNIQQLSKLGIHIGQAFQIQDDIIGIFDTEKNIGKSILSDLAESKKTILVTHAFQHLSGPQRDDFIHLLEKKDTITHEDLDAVRKLLRDAGSLDYSLNEIQKRITQSQSIITSLDIQLEIRTIILNLIDQLFSQSSSIADHHQIRFQPSP